MGNSELDVVWSHALLVGSIKGISEAFVLVSWHPKEPRLHAVRPICSMNRSSPALVRHEHWQT